MATDRQDKPKLREAERLWADGNVQEAINLLAPLIQCERPCGETLHLAGRLWLEGQKDAEAALPHLEQALSCAPDDVRYRLTLGQCLCALERPRQALAILRPLPPDGQDDPQVATTFAIALEMAGEPDASLTARRKAAELAPEDPQWALNLATALTQRDRTREAIKVLQDAVAAHPKHVLAWKQLGQMQLNMGTPHQGIDSWKKSLQIDPAQSSLHSGVVFYSQYLNETTPADLVRQGKEWDLIHGLPVMPSKPTYANTPDPDRPLRLGYVSPDFKWHSVAYFFIPLLASHNRDQFQVICYYNAGRTDSMSATIRDSADAWREIAQLDDKVVADMIRDDGIDILFELAGHTIGNRLTLFALRPAPVQIGWPGYPGSRCIEALDYWITDEIADPPGEPIPPGIGHPLRIEGGYHVYQPDPEANIPIAPPPCQRTGRVTFGSFNQQWKIQPVTVALWAQVLRAVPDSRLLLKAVGFNRAEITEHFRRMFAAEGIGPDRLRCLGSTQIKRRHFELYSQIDVALDTFPYHGTTTTCEALWMGVPSVVLTGNRNAARVGTSLLRQMGLNEWAASTPEEYVRIVTEVAQDTDRLAELRFTLRDRMQNSVLGDPARYAKNYEAACRRAWRTWCAGQGK